MTPGNAVLAAYELGDMAAVYVRDGDFVGLCLVPRGGEGPDPDVSLSEPLVQVAFRGDAASGGFSSGHTLRGGASVDRLKFRSQEAERLPGDLLVTTVLDAGPTVFRHVLRHQRGHRCVQVRTEVVHQGTGPLVLEMLSSFTLGGLSPFAGGREPGTLVVHRIRSSWSNEGRLVSERAEDLQLEPSWSRHGVRVERFGQVGSLPVRKHFPFCAVEDLANGVVWAVQLACPSSWQIEAGRRNDDLCLSGGLADAELGHWSKTLGPGDRFETPWAYLTVARGTVDEVSQRLLDLYEDPDQPPPAALPIVFNEFCSTWGQPSAARIEDQLRVLRGRGVDVFVIDAGWYADPEGGWELGHGDWAVAPHLFPAGFTKTVEAIRREGLRPGLWFELETCGPRSRAYGEEAHLLRRQGYPVTSGQRRFWDMADPWVIRYLTEKVIGRLNADGFEYLKIDYNESIGLGCDGDDSPGEGLRRRLLATQQFFREIRQGVPGIVLENCASGGHRLEASMVGLTDYSSFSDAHECPEIPVLAANLHRVVPPSRSQIWAVVRKTDTPRRLGYFLAATFLGVPCLSGEIEDLTEEQWKLVEAAFRFHRRIAPILCRGTTSFHGPRQQSYRNLLGWQGILRVSGTDREALVVLHAFGGDLPSSVEIPLPWDAAVTDCYHSEPLDLAVHDGILRVGVLKRFEAAGVYLTRR